MECRKSEHVDKYQYIAKDGTKFWTPEECEQYENGVLPNGYDNPVGWWKITTEGDCEGRSIKPIGIFHGHIAELALKYAGYAYYELKFSPAANPTELPEKPKEQVHIQLDIKSGTWDKTPHALACMRKLLHGYNVNLSNYYAAYVISKSSMSQ